MDRILMTSDYPNYKALGTKPDIKRWTCMTRSYLRKRFSARIAKYSVQGNEKNRQTLTYRIRLMLGKRRKSGKIPAILYEI